MITYYYKSLKDPILAINRDFKLGTWIDVYEPSEKEIDTLVGKFNLQRDLLEDALDLYEVPRLEKQDGVTYFFMRVTAYKDDLLIVYPLLIVYSETFVLTLAKYKTEILDPLREEVISICTTQKTNFFFQLLLRVHKGMQNQVRELDKSINQIELHIKNIQSQDIADFVKIEKTLNDSLSILIPTASSLEQLLSGKFIPLYDEDKDLFEDIYLLNGQLIENCQLSLKHTTNIRNAFSDIISNNLNSTMRRLTSFTIILMIPTIVFSFYGMNVALPFDRSPAVLTFILLLTLFLTLLVTMILYKNKWI